MLSPLELRERAAGYLEVPVEAAGIFAADVSVGVRAAGGAAAGAAADAAGVGGSAVLDGVAAAAGMHMAQDAAAHAQGLTGTMLVAITATEIVLLGWKGTSAAGEGPTAVLARFPREQTTVASSKRGATYTVELTGAGRSVAFTGGVGWLSSGKAAKLEVLRALGVQ